MVERDLAEGPGFGGPDATLFAVGTPFLADAAVKSSSDAADRAAALAYAAGVIDSDGSIGIQRETYAMRVLRTATQPTFSERVTIRQIEPEAVDFLHEHFGGSRGLIRYRGTRLNRQPLHSLVFGDRRASQLLSAVLPYLRIKRRQAELCLELRRLKDASRQARFAYGRGHRGGGKRPEHLTAAMEAVRTEVMRLNRVEGRAASHTRREHLQEMGS